MSTDWLPPELPQLARLLDPHEMEQIMASEPFAGSGFSALRLERIRYRPGRNCLITWSASVERIRGPHRTHFSILACRAGESGSYVNPTGPPTIEMATGSIHLPGIDAIIWIFPHDRKLRGITAVDNPSALLADLALELEDVDLPETPKRLEVVQFVAERACTVRLKLRDGRSWAYGKFYRPGESRAPWELINRLWRSEVCQSGQLVIPAPLAHHPATASVWLQGLEGPPLDLGRDGGQLYETGRTLARLHATPLEGLAEITGTELAAQLRRSIETIVMVCPDLRERLEALAGSLAPIGIGPPVTLHGDLHLKNIFRLGEGRIALIDLDNMVSGDRWLDLASLAGYLGYHGLVMQIEPRETDCQINQFRRGYESAAGQVIEESHWRRMVAHALLAERGYRCVTRLKPNLRVDLERLLVMAERLVQS